MTIAIAHPVCAVLACKVASYEWALLAFVQANHHHVAARLWSFESSLGAFRQLCPDRRCHHFISTPELQSRKLNSIFSRQLLAIIGLLVDASSNSANHLTGDRPH